ncbi:MAG: hypothetical protein IJS90_00505 [Clostridia bacterium]|nr:hypothetical protein [Clostridia bacterium]
MKKTISVLLCVILFAGIMVPVCSAGTLPLSSGIDALRDQFGDGSGPSVNGVVMDYCYFVPDLEEGQKYPLVIWLHGLVSGGYPRRQITKNDISYWSSAEFQSRFSAGGAFILAPRSPEAVAAWADTMQAPLKSTIISFIRLYLDKIDTTRIYIGGLSVGAQMTLKMVAAYPEMFAAAFPCSPYGTVNSDLANGCANTPIWELSSKNDYLMGFTTWIQPEWNNLMAKNKRRSDCRWTVMETAMKPDGTATGTTHDTWYAATYDMFMTDNKPFYNSVTYDGNGKVVELTYPNGLISWLNNFTTSYTISPGAQAKDNVFTRIYKAIIEWITGIVKALGLKGILG